MTDQQDPDDIPRLQAEELHILSAIYGGAGEFTDLGKDKRGQNQFKVLIEATTPTGQRRGGHVRIRLPKLYPIDKTRPPVVERLLEPFGLSETQQSRLVQQVQASLESEYRRTEANKSVVLDALARASGDLAGWDADSSSGGLGLSSGPSKRTAFDEREDALRKEQMAEREEDDAREGAARLQVVDHQQRLVLAAQQQLQRRAHAGQQERLLRMAAASDSTAGGAAAPGLRVPAAGAKASIAAGTGADQAAVAAALALAGGPGTQRGESTAGSGPGAALASLRQYARDRFRNDYHKATLLGKGGFGRVLKARNRLDGLWYAVKRVRLEAEDDGLNVKILREVTTLSRLFHRNIVRYYQAWLEWAPPHRIKVARRPEGGLKRQGDASGIDGSGIDGSGIDGSASRERYGVGQMKDRQSLAGRSLHSAGESESSSGSEDEVGLVLQRSRVRRSLGRHSIGRQDSGGSELGQTKVENVGLATPGGTNSAANDSEQHTEDKQRILSLDKQTQGISAMSESGGWESSAASSENSSDSSSTGSFGASDSNSGSESDSKESTTSSGSTSDSSSGFDTSRSQSQQSTSQAASGSDLLMVGARAPKLDFGRTKPKPSDSLRKAAAGLFGLAAPPQPEGHHDSQVGRAPGGISESHNGANQPGNLEKDRPSGSRTGGSLVSVQNPEDSMLSVRPAKGLGGSAAGPRAGVPSASDSASTESKTTTHAARRYLYITMEFCNGATMREVIDNKQLHKDASLTWSLFHQVLEALAYLHGKNVIHRDLKPSNIFLQQQDGSAVQTHARSHRHRRRGHHIERGGLIVKLGDFGLATDRIQSATASATRAGGGGPAGPGLDQGSYGGHLGAVAAISKQMLDGVRVRAHRAAAALGRGPLGDLEGVGVGTSSSSSPTDPLQSQRLEEAAIGDALGDEVGAQEPTITHGAGTLAYMAPEASGVSETGSRQSYGPKVDVFALGIILFECFCPPFTTRMGRAIALERLRCGEIIRDCQASIPKRAQDLILRMVSPIPHHRPSARQLLGDSSLPERPEVEMAYLADAVNALSKPGSALRQDLLFHLFSQATAEQTDLSYDLPTSASGVLTRLARDRHLDRFLGEAGGGTGIGMGTITGLASIRLAERSRFAGHAMASTRGGASSRGMGVGVMPQTGGAAGYSAAAASSVRQVLALEREREVSGLSNGKGEAWSQLTSEYAIMLVGDALVQVAALHGAVQCEPASILPRAAPMSALTAAALVRSADGAATSVSQQLLHLIGEEGLIALSSLAEVLRREEVETKVLVQRRNAAIQKASSSAADGSPPTTDESKATMTGINEAHDGGSSTAKQDRADLSSSSIGDSLLSDSLLGADATTGQNAAVLLDHEGTLVQLPTDLTVPLARYCGRQGISQLRRMALGAVFRRRKEGGQPKEHSQFCYDLLWDCSEIRFGEAARFLETVAAGRGTVDGTRTAFANDDILVSSALGLCTGYNDMRKLREQLSPNGTHMVRLPVDPARRQSSRGSSSSASTTTESLHERTQSSSRSAPPSDGSDVCSLSALRRTLLSDGRLLKSAIMACDAICVGAQAADNTHDSTGDWYLRLSSTGLGTGIAQMCGCFHVEGAHDAVQGLEEARIILRKGSSVSGTVEGAPETAMKTKLPAGLPDFQSEIRVSEARSKVATLLSAASHTVLEERSRLSRTKASSQSSQISHDIPLGSGEPDSIATEATGALDWRAIQAVLIRKVGLHQSDAASLRPFFELPSCPLLALQLIDKECSRRLPSLARAVHQLKFEVRAKRNLQRTLHELPDAAAPVHVNEEDKENLHKADGDDDDNAGGALAGKKGRLQRRREKRRVRKEKAAAERKRTELQPDIPDGARNGLPEDGAADAAQEPGGSTGSHALLRAEIRVLTLRLKAARVRLAGCIQALVGSCEVRCTADVLLKAATGPEALGVQALGRSNSQDGLMPLGLNGISGETCSAGVAQIRMALHALDRLRSLANEAGAEGSAGRIEMHALVAGSAEVAAVGHRSVSVSEVAGLVAASQVLSGVSIGAAVSYGEHVAAHAYRASQSGGGSAKGRHAPSTHGGKHAPRLSDPTLAAARALTFTHLDLGMLSSSGAYTSGVFFQVVAGDIGKRTCSLIRGCDAHLAAPPEDTLLKRRVATLGAGDSSRPFRSSRGKGGPGGSRSFAPAVALMPISEEGGRSLLTRVPLAAHGRNSKPRGKKRSQRSMVSAAQLSSPGAIDSMAVLKGGRYDSQVLRSRVPGDFGPSPIAFGLQLFVDKVAASVQTLATKRAMKNNTSLQRETIDCMQSALLAGNLRKVVLPGDRGTSGPVDVLLCSIAESSIRSLLHRQALAHRLQSCGVRCEYMHPHFLELSEAVLHATRAGLHALVVTSVDEGKLAVEENQSDVSSSRYSPRQSPVGAHGSPGASSRSGTRGLMATAGDACKRVFVQAVPASIASGDWHGPPTTECAASELLEILLEGLAPSVRDRGRGAVQQLAVACIASGPLHKEAIDALKRCRETEGTRNSLTSGGASDVPPVDIGESAAVGTFGGISATMSREHIAAGCLASAVAKCIGAVASDHLDGLAWATVLQVAALDAMLPRATPSSGSQESKLKVLAEALSNALGPASVRRMASSFFSQRPLTKAVRAHAATELLVDADADVAIGNTDAYMVVSIDERGKVNSSRAVLDSGSEVGIWVHRRYGTLKASSRRFVVLSIPPASLRQVRSIGTATSLSVGDGLTPGKAWVSATGMDLEGTEPWIVRSIGCATQLCASVREAGSSTSGGQAQDCALVIVSVCEERMISDVVLI